MPGAGLLVRYAEAFYEDADALAAAAAEIRRDMGDAHLVDAAGTVAVFDAVVKVADATGIPLEDAKAEASADFREALGIDAFRPEA